MDFTKLTPAERLEYYLKFKNISFNTFAREMGCDNLVSHSSKYVGKGKGTMSKYLLNLENAGLNKDWYLTGKGEMLIEDVERKENHKQLILSNDVVPVYDEIIDLIDKLPPDKLKEYLKAKRDFIEKTNIILNNKMED